LSGTPARVRCFSVEIKGKPVVFQKKEYVVSQKIEMYESFRRRNCKIAKISSFQNGRRKIRGDDR
jgi:hypothetical protein